MRSIDAKKVSLIKNDPTHPFVYIVRATLYGQREITLGLIPREQPMLIRLGYVFTRLYGNQYKITW